MQVESFVNTIGADFFTGVPDSQLRALCDYLMDKYGIDPKHHIIAANEGNSAALAAGHYLATGHCPIVYMQNSGEGNIVNPVASLLNQKVYAIPMIFIIGWRGEPGVHDEPQHIFQGEITLKLLEDIGIEYYIVGVDTTEKDIFAAMEGFRSSLQAGKSVAFVIQKNALCYDKKITYQNENSLRREEIIQHIISISGNDPIVSTTGKASRELFELRVANKQGHERDFLTVGSMGHSSSIALGIALSKEKTKVWCVDGDGAVLMHMGAMAVIGTIAPQNFIHIVINNGAHETVGGMPTVAKKIDLVSIAKACGYSSAISVNTIQQLDVALHRAKSSHELSFIEVKSAIGSRANLGRPTTSAVENKISFMEYLRTL